MRLKGNPNEGCLNYLTGSCGCILILMAILYIPLGILLVSGILEDVPIFMQAAEQATFSMPDWGYLAFGLLGALGLAGLYFIYLKKWQGLILLYASAGGIIYLDVYLGDEIWRAALTLLFPFFITIFLWAPWKKETLSEVDEGEKTPADQDYHPPAVLRLKKTEPTGAPPSKKGSITVIPADQIQQRQPPAGMNIALIKIEEMKQTGDILGLLRASIHHINYQDQDAATKALALFDQSEIVPDLVTAMKESDGRIREEAINRLGRSKDARAIKPLLAALKDPDSKVRGGAAYHIGYYQDRRALQPLIDLLDDDDEYVRMSSAKALGEIGDIRACEPLIPLLNDSDEIVIMAVIMALKDVGDQSAVEPLKRALKRNYKVSSISYNISQAIIEINERS